MEAALCHVMRLLLFLAGTAALVGADGIMDHSKDRSILAENLQVSVKQLKKNTTFQHNNDPESKSKSTNERLQKKNDQWLAEHAEEGCAQEAPS